MLFERKGICIALRMAQLWTRLADIPLGAAIETLYLIKCRLGTLLGLLYHKLSHFTSDDTDWNSLTITRTDAPLDTRIVVCSSRGLEQPRTGGPFIEDFVAESEG